MAGKPEKIKRRARGSISAEEIVGGALRLIETDSLDGLSMPKLARELGIGVTSIYWYFKNKDELIDAVTAEAARRLHPLIRPGETSTWQDHLFEFYQRFHTAMRDNDLLCDLLFLRGSRLNENALVQLWPEMEISMAKMVDAGFTPKVALQNLVVLSLYTRGGVVLERQMRQAGMSAETPAPVSEEFPLSSAAAKLHNVRGVSEDAFEPQLRLLIDSMAAYLMVNTPPKSD